MWDECAHLLPEAESSFRATSNIVGLISGLDYTHSLMATAILPSFPSVFAFQVVE